MRRLRYGRKETKGGKTNMKTKAELKKYMQEYYQEHKEERRQEYRKWCEDHPNQNRSERGKEFKSSAQKRAYNKEYYHNHKKRYAELHRRWCAGNPEKFADSQQAWRERNPHKQRDYVRGRLAVVEPLIFQFLDSGGLGEDPGEFIQYLHSQGIPEQHTSWFEADLEKCLTGKRECRRE